MATVAVGDIHGNYLALDDLLSKFEPELGSDDELVFLGDYIDDGEDVHLLARRSKFDLAQTMSWSPAT